MLAGLELRLAAPLDERSLPADAGGWLPLGGQERSPARPPPGRCPWCEAVSTSTPKGPAHSVAIGRLTGASCQLPARRRRRSRSVASLHRKGCRGVATSGQASSAYHGVDAGAGYGPRTVLSNDRLPPASIERGERRVDRDLHLTGGGRCGPGDRIDRAVADQRQGPPGRDRCRHPSHQLLHRSCDVDVQARHEVVVVRLRRPGS